MVVLHGIETTFKSVCALIIIMWYNIIIVSTNIFNLLHRMCMSILNHVSLYIWYIKVFTHSMGVVKACDVS